MARRNTSTNPLFRKIRELEERAVELGIVRKTEIMTSQIMREEAWTDYLIRRGEWLADIITKATGGIK